MCAQIYSHVNLSQKKLDNCFTEIQCGIYKFLWNGGSSNVIDHNIKDHKIIYELCSYLLIFEGKVNYAIITQVHGLTYIFRFFPSWAKVLIR